MSDDRPDSPPRELDQIQRWMQSVIMHPRGIVAGIAAPEAQQQIPVAPDEVESVITRSHALNSIERLQIYGNAYIARLLDVMAGEFPALQQSLGDDLFAAFAMDYLQAHPSRSYTLADLGEQFPAWLRETRSPREEGSPGPDWADWMADLAALERDYSEVFDGPGVENDALLTPDDLLAIPQEQWPQLRLQPVVCLRLRSYRFPVHEYKSAITRGEENPAIPSPEPVHLAISRIEYRVRRWQLEPLESALLHQVIAGLPLQAAIEASLTEDNLPDDFDLDGFADLLRGWFQKWAAAGFFTRAIAPME